MDRKLSIAIAGATGYIGLAACRYLADRFRVIGLARRPGHAIDIPGVEWRICDLFSYVECEQALKGVDLGLYLVHSMIPSAHLTQGTFQDMDLILADNFARAAKKRALSRILYLGGLLPKEGESPLSRHLASRLEVEQTLASWGTPLTALRAGIVLGSYGSSFSIFRTLLERLRWIPCPRWSRSLTQPVDLEDILELFRYCLDHPGETVGTFDVGCPDVVSYRQMLEGTAELMGKRRFFFDVPLRGSNLCKLWLCAVTRAPMALVSPLVESMRFSMVARDHCLQEMAGLSGKPLGESLKKALEEEKAAKLRKPVAHPAAPSHYDVRSVQRLPLPPGFSARDVAGRYIRWLPWFFQWLLRCEVDAERNVRVMLALFRWRWTLLELAFRSDRSPGDDRQVYFITGGALVQKVDLPSRRPRLEFREVLDRTAVLMAIHDYRPRLPAWFYVWTQAKAHVITTRSFGKHLMKISRRRASKG